MFTTTYVVTPLNKPRPEPVDTPHLVEHTQRPKQIGKGKSPHDDIPTHFMDPSRMMEDDPTVKPRKKKVYKPGERLLKRLYKEHLARVSEHSKLDDIDTTPPL
jgi:hypothetical protein